MPLNELSNELFLEVFRHIDAFSNPGFRSKPPRDLLALSLCCRRFYDIAQPLLYSRFNQSTWKMRNVAAFFRAVVAQPRRARYVKDFRVLIDASEENFGLDTDLSHVTQEEEDQVRRTWMSDSIYGTTHCDAWHQKLFFSLNNWDAMAAVLLRAFSANLEFIDLYFSKGPSNSDFMRVIDSLTKGENLSGHSSLMPRLRNVSISQYLAPPTSIEGVSIKHLVPFLRLETVREFVGTAINDEAWTDPERLHHFNAIDVHLVRCNLDDVSMRSFLRCFRSLKAFMYSLYWNRSGLKPSAIVDGLSHLQHCLETLVVDNEFDWTNWRSLEDTPITLDESLGPLTDFGRLRILVVDAYILLGSERTDRAADETFEGAEGQLKWYYTNEQISSFTKAFPPSLEFLHIRKCSTAIFDCVTELIFRDHAPPSLKKLHLRFRKGSPIEPCDGNVEDLEKAALAKRIELRHWTGP